jgi:hypothetical protein
LILCSVVALALIIERFYHLRPAMVAPPKLLDEVIGVTRASLPAADVVNKLADSSVLGRVLAAGLRSVIAEPRITEPALRQAFENAGRAAVHRPPPRQRALVPQLDAAARRARQRARRAGPRGRHGRRARDVARGRLAVGDRKSVV